MSTGARVGDEVIVVPDIEKSGGWGNAQRNEGIIKATCDYIAFMDDDDYYVDGARDIMERTIKENPGLPVLFRMKYPDGTVLWKTKEVIPGNISTQMILVPNSRYMLGTFPGKRNMADFLFIDAWKWPKGSIVWSEEVIALLGHNNIGDIRHE